MKFREAFEITYRRIPCTGTCLSDEHIFIMYEAGRREGIIQGKNEAQKELIDILERFKGGNNNAE